MKSLLLSLVTLLTIPAAPVGRVDAAQNPLQGIVCLDIVERLEKNSQAGNKVLVWQCCGGIKLFATLRLSRGKTIASNWKAEDAKGGKLDYAKQTRTTSVSLKEVNQKYRELLVVIKSQKLCFIIKRDVMK